MKVSIKEAKNKSSQKNTSIIKALWFFQIVKWFSIINIFFAVPLQICKHTNEPSEDNSLSKDIGIWIFYMTTFLASYYKINKINNRENEEKRVDNITIDRNRGFNVILKK
ncbi:MAG: hypothetical protein J0H68_08365 [Sphingobacteriia bacterium]|nr:hypothetical protein [Sphingobacteriia bacterium]